MSLSPGTKLGPYKIQSLIGSGGMGEVYRARDTRLDRNVAVKVIRANLTRDPDSRLRFEREARAVSSLMHPNICPLFDVGKHEDIDYLVMQYLEGENLAFRLTRGPLPPELALRCAIDVSSALEAAHRNGVLHRDLKPGNIMLTKSGAKLMDFGLAKLLPSDIKAIDKLGTTKSPAKNFPVTSSGTVVGTLQYMAPEVIEGAQADERSDIFSFGTVVYEMLTGRPAFQGKTLGSVIAAILNTSPEPVRTLQPVTPPELDRIVAACLTKDPSERVSAIHDVRLQLEWVREQRYALPESPAKVTNNSGRRWRVVILSLAVAFASLALFAWYRLRSEASSIPVIRATIVSPENVNFASRDVSDTAVVSPDGRNVAFLASAEGVTELWIRPLDSFAARRLPGTEGADEPFWSPDNHALGFFVGGKLKRVSLSGGPPLTVCNVVEEPRGGSWSKQDVIIFGKYPGEIYRVRASGGTPERVSEFDTKRHDTTHRWPVFLPDGNHFLYLASEFGSANQDNMYYVGALDGKEHKALTHGSSNLQYANGYLLYLVERTLMAQPFDPDKLAFTGDASAIAQDVDFDFIRSNAIFSVSSNGVLVYRTGTHSQENLLKVFSRQQGKVMTLGKPADYIHPRLSPDAKRVAYHMLEPTTGRTDIWIQELKNASRYRLTLDPTRSRTPVWSPDGNKVAYYSLRSGKSALYVKNVNGVGTETEIREPDNVLVGVPTDWTPDGSHLIVHERQRDGKFELSLVPVNPAKPSSRLLDIEGADAGSAHISPNGWLAYESDESGSYEVYVTPYPPNFSDRVQVSSGGGRTPRWTRGGKELLYLGSDHKLMVAEVSFSKNSVEVTSLKSLMPKPILGRPDSYDVSRDGNWVVFEDEPKEHESIPLNVVINWMSELKQRP